MSARSVRGYYSDSEVIVLQAALDAATQRAERAEAQCAVMRETIQRIHVRTEAKNEHWEAHRSNIREWCYDALATDAGCKAAAVIAAARHWRESYGSGTEEQCNAMANALLQSLSDLGWTLLPR